MFVLGIESSCDETAAAVVQDGTKLLSTVVVSQIDTHKEFGGVVPEVAARSHIEAILPVIDKAVSDSGQSWRSIDAIAVTHGPGLIGSLLIGTLTARTLSVLKDKPLYNVHHVLGHVYANFITSTGSQLEKTHPAFHLPSDTPEFPVLALIISGGHSLLALFHGHFDYELLGETQDDAVGEAFDKASKVLGLSYPGGPAIAKAALKGDPNKYDLPEAKLENIYDFSFSGLKTALLRLAQREIGEDYSFPSIKIASRLNKKQIADMAASFQDAAVKTLVNKTRTAFEEYSPKSVVIAGGVAANKLLREKLSDTLDVKIEYAPPELCTDNAAMIAALAYFQSKKYPAAEPLVFSVEPSLPITSAILGKQ